MKTDNNFVRSGHERIANDNYQTVDKRCIEALLEVWSSVYGVVIDCCAPTGSGIVDGLHLYGRSKAYGVSDAINYTDNCSWVVSNPPYKRGLVDDIINSQILKLDSGQISNGVAMLLRTGFDHAKTRLGMFEKNRYYAGQIKMTFRPVWFEGTETTPIHNYVWHIWSREWVGRPNVWYW